MTRRLDEETLNAYCDGALDVEARAEVEVLLQADAEARDRLAKLRRANALAIEAFGAPMQEPQPQALIDIILQDRDPRSGPAGPRWMRGLGAGMRNYAVPLAASLALAIGIAAGLMLARQTEPASIGLALGTVPRESPLHRLLDHALSGQIQEMGSSDGRHAVLATFRDRGGRPCREIEVLPPETGLQPIAAGVACRAADGGWVVEGAVSLAHAAGTGAQHYEPSGVTEKDALEGLLNLLGAQAALSPEEERALVQRGWR
jgi:hypothetical protein